MDGNPRATIGDNRPPSFDPAIVEDLSARASEFLTGSQKWLDMGEITNETHASQLTDQLSGLRGLYKSADDARKAAKKPHDDAGREVQAAFKPILTRIETAANALKKMAGAYVQKKEKAAREEQARRAEEARKAEEEAARLQKEAESTGNLAATIEAEEAMERAADAEKLAARKIDTTVKSASGAGRTIAARTTYEVEITNIRVLFMYFQDRPEVRDFLQRLAAADVRAKDVDHSAIPGIVVHERKSVA